MVIHLQPSLFDMTWVIFCWYNVHDQEEFVVGADLLKLSWYLIHGTCGWIAVEFQGWLGRWRWGCWWTKHMLNSPHWDTNNDADTNWFVKFVQDTDKRHPIACLWRQAMGCILWVISMIYILYNCGGVVYYNWLPGRHQKKYLWVHTIALLKGQDMAYSLWVPSSDIWSAIVCAIWSFNWRYDQIWI